MAKDILLQTKDTKALEMKAYDIMHFFRDRYKMNVVKDSTMYYTLQLYLDFLKFGQGNSGKSFKELVEAFTLAW